MPAEEIPLSDYFTWVDWLVVFGYLGLTTLVGHFMKGKQASIKDFFLGGRTLPWPAVSGSIIATEISGVTFVGVPGLVFAAGGDFTYLQWAIGSIAARILVGIFFVRAYYEKEIYSPYDFMGNRLGVGVKRLATGIFWIGSILGQSVRVLVAALALRVILPESVTFEHCIIIIGVFAIGWTLMGGMRTVIWTDVMQFFLFAVGGSVALFWIVGHLGGGWGEFWSVASGGREFGEALMEPGGPGDENKFRLFNFATDPAVEFTLWVALIAVPFQNLSAFGVDQLNAQRMFCCKNAGDARKAIIFSSFGQLLALLMLLVGAGLFVFYQAQPPSAEAAARFAENNDYVFPVWITTTLPTGLRGLILAGVFAAAISSLDSILAALSQTTLSLFRHHGTDEDAEQESEAEAKRGVVLSRLLVMVWGVFLTGFAIALYNLQGNINIVALAFGMVAYSTGPMLGLFLAALFRLRGSFGGIVAGAVISFFLVLLVRTDIYVILQSFGIFQPSDLPSFWPVGPGATGGFAPAISFAWMYPVTTFVTLGCGALGAKLKKP
ncbi:sodium:solute symporter [soil metagenome]